MPREDSCRAAIRDERITHMVNRFLQWKLPKDFQPDCGIHFDANGAKKLNPTNHTYEPVGTNLLSADQAKEMVLFMIDGLPGSSTIKAGMWFVECRVNEKFEGWFAAPPEGIGGWLTLDTNQAKKYTEAEAKAVASALSYFRCPFPYLMWIATEHVFMTADSTVVTEA